ncbi:type II toxin-antitoxin system HicB family antitoxin [Rhizobium sp. LCM 4573]|uniref:type II toxin-antitoxin system HicB family antitoxin n=1 Tax=Rhizobium sp. LCM 4573 TaxID=1848291 RepID=UPI0008D9AEE6|nr:type II toxin-antitoxin system HicB family antitoxin [Rhizobium sp. LCM 4573]OHV82880.1 DNA repair protein [Rhizobium sp. LCM 4573]
MNNVVEINGERAVVAFDPEIQMLRGEFVGLNGGADFYAENVHDLIEEGRKSLALHLEMCQEKGIEPRRKYSGKFNLRLTPDDHAAAVIAAAAAGKSLNEWIVGTIREATE